MLGHLRVWLLWWALCAALWLMLVDRTPTDELLAGAGVAGRAATVVAVLRAQRQVVLRFRARWLLRAWRPVLGVVTDLVPLLRALPRRGGGALVEVPFGAVGEDPETTAFRVLTETLGSTAPNTIVVEVDRDRRVLLAHQLVRTAHPERDAAPLGTEPP